MDELKEKGALTFTDNEKKCSCRRRFTDYHDSEGSFVQKQ